MRGFISAIAMIGLGIIVVVLFVQGEITHCFFALVVLAFLGVCERLDNIAKILNGKQ